MLVNIIIFFLLLILLILISINISTFIQNKKIWKGGGQSTPYDLLKILKKNNKENFYDAYTYPVFLKGLSTININKALNILVEMERPNVYANIDGKLIISPNTSFDIYAIRDAWKNMPITAISSKSFVLHNNKSINVYYIGSVYIMDVFNKIYYISTISLLLLEANRIAHIEKKNAYIILVPLFPISDIVSCYRDAIKSSICDKIDSIHIYLPTISRGEKIIIVNRENKEIILQLESAPITDNNNDILSKLNMEKKSFYSKFILVRQYITDGIANFGNLYWAASTLSTKDPNNKYLSELAASNNSLVPLYANTRTNPKYISNIKQRSIVFDNTNFIDWRLSYDKLNYIDNLDFVIGEKEILSDIFNILLNNELPNANIIEQIIHYYIKKDNYIFYAKNRDGLTFTRKPFYLDQYFMAINGNLLKIFTYLFRNSLNKLYGIIYLHFIFKKDKTKKKNGNEIETAEEISKILEESEYLPHKTKVLQLLNRAKFAIMDPKNKHSGKFVEYRQHLVNEYMPYFDNIFLLFTKLINFFKKWKNSKIPLVNFLSHYFSINNKIQLNKTLLNKTASNKMSLEEIVSIFNKTDEEKMLLFMPFLLLWDMWKIDTNISFIKTLIKSDKKENINEYALFIKSIYKIYLLAIRVVLIDQNPTIELIQNMQRDVYNSIFDKFTKDTDVIKIKEYMSKRQSQLVEISKGGMQISKGGTANINTLQEKLKKDLNAIDIDKDKILDSIDENKKIFNEKSNEFKKLNYAKFDKNDHKFVKFIKKNTNLLTLHNKKDEFDELIEIERQHKLLIAKILQYKKDKKDIADKFAKDTNTVYKKIDKNNLLKEQQLKEQQLKEQQLKEMELMEPHMETSIIEMLTTIQSSKKDSAYGMSNTSNPYKDKLLTLFEWFTNIPNNNIILIMNIGNIQKMPFGPNAIYFIPIIPSEKYLYNGKWYSIGDIISIDALKNIPNGMYYYRENELYFD